MLRKFIMRIAARKCLGFKTPYKVFEENTGISMKSALEIALMA